MTISQDAAVTEKKKEKQNKGKSTSHIIENYNDKILLIMPQLKLLYIPFETCMTLSGVMVNLPQPLWGQEKPSHQAHQDKFKQSEPGKSSS